MYLQQQLMQIAKQTGEKQEIIVPVMYSSWATFDSPLRKQKTKWTATPNKDGGVELSFEDITNHSEA
jgi:hypothetical protein